MRWKKIRYSTIYSPSFHFLLIPLVFFSFSHSFFLLSFFFIKILEKSLNIRKFISFKKINPNQFKIFFFGQKLNNNSF